jgi:hypothetical protein
MTDYRSRPLLWVLLAIIAALLILLAWIWWFGPASDRPAEVLSVTPTAGGPGEGGAVQRLTLSAPAADATVGSPFELRGRAAALPFEGGLVYRISDASGRIVGQAPFPVQGELGQPAEFTATAVYTLPVASTGRVEVAEFTTADGIFVAGESITVTLQPTGAQPQPPASPQAIFVDTPPPGTQVGSPVVITGRTATFPNNGRLGFRITDANGVQIGGGWVPVAGAAELASSFTANIFFNLPANGGPIRAEFFDADPAGAPIASGGIELSVAAPSPEQQAIFVDTPLPGTQVGSPVVLTGRTSLFPAGGTLSYLMVDAIGREIGAGTFPVQGTPGGPGSFTANITFNLPPNGGPIRVTIFEPGAAGAQPGASVSINLNTASPNPPTAQPQPQQSIVIDTPPPGVPVGSPVVLTGRTTRYPTGGRLNWRALDGAGNPLGGGTFPVTGAPNSPATFVASLEFSLPPSGGPVSFELTDVDSNGARLAQATIGLNVNPPGPTEVPPPTQQQIIIETPPPNTPVGSPVVITGRTTVFPFEGSLSYVIRDAANNSLGSGAFQVQNPCCDPATFVASIDFNIPPGYSGPITAEIFQPDEATGGVRASSSVTLQISPPAPPTAIPPPTEVPPTDVPQPTAVPPTDVPQPTAIPPTEVPPPTIGPQVEQQVIIETPAENTPVGSPLVVTGRTQLFPNEGSLAYEIFSLAGREQLGSGAFQVDGVCCGPATFTGNLTFAAPPSFSGPILLEIFERDAASGEKLGTATLRLVVEAPYPAPQPSPRGAEAPGGQEIVLDAPPPGASVGSPLEVLGRVARYPAGGVLRYRVSDGAGRELGSGEFAVAQASSQPIVFVGELSFTPPPEGGPIAVEVFEQNGASRTAMAALSLVAGN